MLAGVMAAVMGVPIFAITVFPALARAIGRRIEGGPGPEVIGELQELRDRVQLLEEREARMAEWEERLEFAERLLSERDPGRALNG